MKYISGIYALNLRCSLETCGDWHTSSFSWEKLHFWESEGSFFGEYGIEPVIFVPEHEGEPLYQANHIRALLDMLYDRQFERAQGMKEDYICNDKYTKEIFEKVWTMNILPYFSEIDAFMEREYRMKWVDFKGGKAA